MEFFTSKCLIYWTIGLAFVLLLNACQSNPRVIIYQKPYPQHNETIYLPKLKFAKMHPITLYDQTSNKLYFCYMDFEIDKLRYNINMLNETLKRYNEVINYLVQKLKNYNYTIYIRYEDIK